MKKGHPIHVVIMTSFLNLNCISAYVLHCVTSESADLNRAQPGGHFSPSTGSEYLDVLFAGSGYEPSTICSICGASQFHVPVIF